MTPDERRQPSSSGYVAGLAHADLLIVGAGVAGLTSAMVLHQAGLKVAVVDAGEPAGESTWAGGGIISTAPPWDYPDAVNRLVARSRELFPDLVQRLESETRIDCEYRTCGLLLLTDPGVRGQAWLMNAGEYYERGRVRDFEPELADGSEPAIRLDDVAQVRNPRLGRALAEWIEMHEIPLLAHTPARSLELTGDAVTGVVLEDGARIRSDAVVLAAGAWTDRILENSLLDGVGIHPVRGQMLLFNPGRRLIRHIVCTGAGYLVPRADGRILAGSTVEQADFDRRPTEVAYRQLLEAAVQTLPALSEDQIECQWLGFRPGIAGEVPAIGAYPGIRGLWLNTGGYRNGLGIAPAAAELLLRQLEGGALTQTFAPVPKGLAESSV